MSNGKAPIRMTGTHLHLIIAKWFGAVPDKAGKCGCQTMIGKMNRWGSARCRHPDQMKQIVSAMIEAAEKRGWKAAKYAKMPAAMACRQIVLLACRRAERDAKRSERLRPLLGIHTSHPPQ
jgi:hypothetical protein